MVARPKLTRTPNSGWRNCLRQLGDVVRVSTMRARKIGASATHSMGWAALGLEIRALDCGSVTHSNPHHSLAGYEILRNVNDSRGIQHLGSKGLKESVSCICEQAINPAVCRSDFQLVPPMWSRAALARVANCWCPRVMWCCPEDGASIFSRDPLPSQGRSRLSTPLAIGNRLR